MANMKTNGLIETVLDQIADQTVRAKHSRPPHRLAISCFLANKLGANALQRKLVQGQATFKYTRAAYLLQFNFQVSELLLKPSIFLVTAATFVLKVCPQSSSVFSAALLCRT